VMTIMRQSLTDNLCLDEEGFLCYPEAWTRDVARILAEGEAPDGLTDDHWKVIDCLRQFYLQYHTVPQLTMLRRFTGFKLAYVYKLFPSGLAKGACRIAGMPRATISPSFLYP